MIRSNRLMGGVFLIGLAISTSVWSRNDAINVASASNGGPWGNWTTVHYCPPDTWAVGVAVRVEGFQGGGGDDSALNAIRLFCKGKGGEDGSYIEPHGGYWGNWSSAIYCPSGQFFSRFSLKVEPPQKGHQDDTAANAVAFMCTDGATRIETPGVPGWDWGSYGGFIGPLGNKAAICGMRVKVEPDQGSGDDTALNDVEFTWCRLP